MNDDDEGNVAYRKKSRKKRVAIGNVSAPAAKNPGKEVISIDKTSRIQKKLQNEVDDLDTTERRSRKIKSPSHRLPRSVSEEVLAMEGNFYPERNVNKPSFQSEQSYVKRSTVRNVKKKKKIRERNDASGEDDNYEGDMDGEISDIFPIEHDDYITENGVKMNGSKQHVVAEPPSLPSQPIDFMFIEKKDGQGFVKEHESKVVNKIQNKTDYAIKLLENEREHTALEFMLRVQNLFRSFATIAQGLLAGMAVSQCMFVYVLSSTDVNLLNNYHLLASPFQSIYYFLSVFCSVSVLDRYLYTSSTFSQFMYRLLSKPSRIVSILAYLLALIFTISLAQFDDRISLYKDIPQLWRSDGKLKTWKIVNLLRAIGAVLGWIILAVVPSDDHTERTIVEAINIEKGSGIGKKSPHTDDWKETTLG